MNITMVTVTVYFVGIAAVVNVPPHNNITKSVVFPAAVTGATYVSSTSTTTDLEPHETFLFVKDTFIAGNAGSVCAQAGGVLESRTSYNVCKIALNGAKVWALTSQGLSEDSNFQKIPTFGQYCPSAKDLPDKYFSDPIDAAVAARFDIKGGKVGACNRGSAFVTTLEVISNDNTLYIQQDGKTSRVILTGNSAVIAIENRPLTHVMTEWQKHFGWYYQMNERAATRCDLPTSPPTAVAGPASCGAIWGVTDDVTQMAAASADCSNSNFP
jgi:hypothetical protein